MSSSAGAPNGGQDFNLNLTPIVDCFTVLITFMLASASFLAIGIFDASVAADASAGNESKPPPIRIDIMLTTNMNIQLNVRGKLRRSKKLSPKEEDKYDTKGLVKELKALTSRFPKTAGYVLSFQDDVEYQGLIGVMEVLKHDLPQLSVLLGGL